MSLRTGSNTDSTLEIENLIQTCQSLGVDDVLIDEALNNPIGGNYDSRKIIGLLKLLAENITAGGGGGGGSSTSTIAWKPTVDANGNISWVRTASTTTPTTQNIKGERGEDGEKGEKGDKGDTGEKGTDGIDGYSPTVVENANNTEDNYKLDITTKTTSYTTPNLKGKQGVQGLQGTRGEKGDKGDTGLTGEKGADGVSPTVTENADNSDTTYKLDIVDVNGTHTTPNLIGRQGAQGLKGDKGDVGEKGEQGIQGIAGTDGVSPLITTNTANTEDVYKLDITDANGTFTTPNLVGRQGVQGIQGEKGEQGEQGIQGIQGIQGEKGEDGYPFLIYREYSSLDDFDPDHFPEIGLMFMIKAEDGQDSYPIYRYTGMVDTPYSFVTDLATSEGLKGEKGDKGDQGIQGIQGEKGADGITYTPVIGTVTTVGSTSDATADIVVDSVAKTATFNFAIPKGSNGAIGGKGDKGEKGDTGEKGDAGVDGITYTPTIGTVSTVDSTSEASASVDIDTDNARATFNFSIPRGADGLQGLQGIQGKQGIQGEAGKDGEDGTTYTPSIGEVTTVDSNELASASVSVNTETKEAVFNFAIPKGNKGLDGVQISDNETVEDKTWSSKKTSDEIAKVETELKGNIDKVVGGVVKYERNEHSTGAGSTSGIDIVTLPKGHKYIVVAHFQINKTITDAINMNGSVVSNGVGVTVRYMPHNGGGADATLLIDATNENAVIRCYSHNPTSEDLYFQYTVQVMTLA